MVIVLDRPTFRVRQLRSAADLHAALRLRSLCFRGGATPDQDGFDAAFDHILVESAADGLPLATLRFRVHASGAELTGGYVGAQYDMSAWSGVRGAVGEVGRLCVRPGAMGPDVLRCVWSELVRLSLVHELEYLVGCTSFEGTEVARYSQAFALLNARHRGPKALTPGRLGEETFALAGQAGGDAKAGLAQLPKLLRSYLGMGGWVGGHVVVDRVLGTLHLFTALEVAAIPPRRLQTLRALAAV